MARLHHRHTSYLVLIISALITVGCRPAVPPSPIPTGTVGLEENTPRAVLPTQQPDPVATGSSHSSIDLDLREANIVAVEFEALGDGRYRFDVTLLHDDDREAPSYADRWLVEDPLGNLLGERVLTHSHSSLPFTRSTTIEIPAEIEYVLVRGHDMEHGYGGQSMQVDLETGELSPYHEE